MQTIKRNGKVSNLGMSYNAVANAVKRLIGKQILVKKEKIGNRLAGSFYLHITFVFCIK
jgi:hypothetical protein